MSPKAALSLRIALFIAVVCATLFIVFGRSAQAKGTPAVQTLAAHYKPLPIDTSSQMERASRLVPPPPVATTPVPVNTLTCEPMDTVLQCAIAERSARGEAVKYRGGRAPSL